jgi:cobalamin biosynthesis protein CobD/CbiB
MMPDEFPVLILAAVLDYSIGDPWGWPHPVQAMGWAIDRYTRLVFNIWNNPAGKIPPAGDRPAGISAQTAATMCWYNTSDRADSRQLYCQLVDHPSC